MNAPPTESAAARTAHSPHPRAPRLAASPTIRALAGPALIVVAVLVVMQGFWLQGRLTNQQVDLLTFWISRWSMIGQALRHGQVPTWLPNEFGGVPFASDPQSGWLYLPVMLLFTAFPPARAFVLFISLQPVLAGLGMYWFFRNERLSRPAATAGGLVMALAMAGSQVSLSMPFAGSLAWTAVALAAAAGYVHARRPAATAGWLALSGLAWSQVAAAHLTDGLLTGAMTVGLYLLARSWVQVRRGDRTAGAALGRLALLAAVLPLLAAPVVWPRLQLLPRTSIGHGYVTLAHLATSLSGQRTPAPIALTGVGIWWGTGFARAPGAYVGALAVLLIPVALASRRWRVPAGAFALLGLIGWALNLNLLIASRHVRALALATSLGTLWLRSPYRFRYLLLTAFAAMAAYGLQAWLEMARVHGRAGTMRRAIWFAGPLLVFGVAPLVAGADWRTYIPFLVGGAIAESLLLAWARGIRWAAVALPVALAVELTATGVAGQLGPAPKPPRDVLNSPATSSLGGAFPNYHVPEISPAAYLDPGPIGRVLVAHRTDGGRLLPYDPAFSTGGVRGFLFHQLPRDWPSFALGRGTLFGLNQITGYSPVQLMRYWEYVRALDRKAPIYYNSASFQVDPRQLLNLFAVEWITQPRGLRPPPGSVLAASQGMWRLYRLEHPAPRASMLYVWRGLRTPLALPAVTSPSFDPARVAIVEHSPEVRGTPLIPYIRGDTLETAASYPPSPTNRVVYTQLNPEHVRIRVTTSAPGLLLIRDPWDQNWHATIDGTPAPDQPTDFVMQGVAVPKGTHTVDLVYRDAPVGQGLAAGAVAWAILLGVWAVLRRRDRLGRGNGPDADAERGAA